MGVGSGLLNFCGRRVVHHRTRGVCSNAALGPEPVADPDFWCRAGDVVRAHDPHVQGIIVLGKEASAEALVETFAAARSEKLVRGFAIGRTIFGAPARKWFDGEIDDAAAHDMMAATYSQLIEAWNNAAHQPVNMAASRPDQGRKER